MKNLWLKILLVIVLLTISFATYVFLSKKINKKLVRGLNNHVTVQIDSGSTASETKGILTVTMPDNKKIEINEIKNEFPQAKTAKEYNELDRKNYENNLPPSKLPPIPGFTDDFIQEINTSGSNWDSAIEVNAFHLASSEGLRVKKFIILDNNRVYEVYFIFPQDLIRSDLVISILKENIIFN